MALMNIPELPKGLHPFFSIWKHKKNDMYIILSSDIKMKKQRNTAYIDNVIVAYQSKNGEKWEFLDPKSFYCSDYKCLYSNYDIIDENDGSIFVSKSVDATEIKIEGGNNVTLKKGMVWNLGKGITIEPEKAFQFATFESNNKSVCTIDERGHLVAVGEGDCIITITSK